MKAARRIAAGAVVLGYFAIASVAAGASISESIESDNRTEANRDRDEARKPGQVLAFIGLDSGDVVLDWGAGGGYWSELMSGVVGEEGEIYAQQTAGERFDSRKAAYLEQFTPFGNIELLPVARGERIPLDDDSVDTVLLSYLYHHMHYAEASGDVLPGGSAAVLAEFARVLKPGGTFIVIDHVAAAGTSRAQSAGWHRVPPETVKADITGNGFEFVGEAPEIFHNPDDDLMNNWNEAGLRGHTTTFVHKYRSPE